MATGLVFFTCCLNTGFLSSTLATGCACLTGAWAAGVLCTAGFTLFEVTAGFFVAFPGEDFLAPETTGVPFFVETDGFACADLLADATGFFTTGVLFLGLSFFTCLAGAGFLATTFLATGFAAFLGCTFLTAFTGFFLIAIWLGFFCDKHC
jgi:hypothetical protein